MAVRVKVDGIQILPFLSLLGKIILLRVLALFLHLGTFSCSLLVPAPGCCHFVPIPQLTFLWSKRFIPVIPVEVSTHATLLTLHMRRSHNVDMTSVIMNSSAEE